MSDFLEYCRSAAGMMPHVRIARMRVEIRLLKRKNKELRRLLKAESEALNEALKASAPVVSKGRLVGR